MNTKRVLVSWSSGKDCAWMLHKLQSTGHEIAGLVTTFQEATDCVPMHSVAHSLVTAQARAVEIPLIPVMLPWPCPNVEYERRLLTVIQQQAEQGVTHLAFGDLFLEDIRDYRIELLSGTGVEPLFSIWCGREGTPALAREIISAGFHAMLTCIDSRKLSQEFLGREFDTALLADLPSDIDPCGENGEFHTFCYAGPHMQTVLTPQIGPIHEKEGFVFAETSSKEA